VSKFKRKSLPKKRIRKNNGNGKKKTIVVKGGNGNGNGSNGKLTRNEKIFVDEWLIDRNGTRAYKIAYPRIKNDNSAGVAAFNMLRKFKIDAYIQKRLEKLSATSRIDLEWLLKRYEMLADYCISDFFNDNGSMKLFSQIPKEKLYAIGGFKQSKKTLTLKDETIIEDRIKEFKLSDKKSVLDSLGKYLGIFAEDNKQKGFGQGNTIIGRNIQVNLVKRD